MKKRYTIPPHGFTIVELAVAIVISMLLVGAIVSFTTGIMDQYGVSAVRNQLSTRASSASSQLENDISYARYATSSNFVTDTAAPTSQGGKWYSGNNQLVLSTTARNTAGKTLTGSYPGEFDNIVYYLKSGNLYRRLLASPTSGNRYTTVTCSPSSNGGCPSDTLVASGVDSFTVTYYTGATTVAPSVDAATSIGFEITLKANKSRQTITQSSKSRASLLPVSDVASGPDIDPYAGLPTITIGHNGIDMTGNSSLLSAKNIHSIGGFELHSGAVSATNNLTAINYGCGTSPAFPVVCPSSSSGIYAGASVSSVTANTICSNSSPVYSGSGTVTAPTIKSGGCSGPDSLPLIDRQALYDSIHSGNSSTTSSTTCSAANPTFQSNWKYMSTSNDISITTDCTINGTGVIYLEGSLTLKTGSTLRSTASMNSSEYPIIVVSEKVTIQKGVNTTGKMIIIGFDSFSGCNNPSCNTATNTNLYNSRYSTAIDISTSGSSSVNISASLYAPFATISLTGPGYGTVNLEGRVVGQRLNIDYTRITSS